MPSFLNSQHRAKLHSDTLVLALLLSLCYHPTDCSFLTHFSRQDGRKSESSQPFPYCSLLSFRCSFVFSLLLGFSHLLTFRSGPHTNRSRSLTLALLHRVFHQTTTTKEETFPLLLLLLPYPKGILGRFSFDGTDRSMKFFLFSPNFNYTWTCSYKLYHPGDS